MAGRSNYLNSITTVGTVSSIALTLVLSAVMATGPASSVQDAAADELINPLTLNQAIEDIAFNPSTNKIYVLESSSVLVLDGGTNSVLADIPIGFYSNRLLLNELTNTAYITTKVHANREGYSANHVIAIMNTENDTLLDRVPIPGGQNVFPFLDAVNPHTNSLYFYNGSSPLLYIMDGETRKITSSAKFEKPALMAVDPLENKIFVATSDEHGPIQVSAVNGSTFSLLSNILELRDSPDGSYLRRPMAFNSATNTLYVAVLNAYHSSGEGGAPIPSSTMYVIDTSSLDALAVVAKLKMYNPTDIAIDVDRGLVYVADYTYFINVIDGHSNEIIRRIEDIPRPELLEINPDTGNLYVSQYAAPVLHMYGKDGPEFLISSSLEDKEYFIKGVALNVTVNSFTINPGRSIEIRATPAGDNGTLSVTLPSSMIDGIIAIDAYSSAGAIGKLEFEQTGNSTMTHLTIKIPPETSSIQIMGTHVVPEFSISLMPIIAGAIGVTAFFAWKRCAIARN